MEELLFNTPAAIGLRLSARLAAVLTSRRIAFCREWDHIIFPKDVIVEAYATFVRQAEFFELGAFSYAETSHYLGRVSVGRYTSIASEVEIFGERHPSEWVTQSMITYDLGYRGIQMAHEDFGAGLPAPVGFPNRHGGRVIIGHDVWIGRHVQLARGITIGHGAMVGAGSVVTRDIPPYTVVAGVPAKPIRPRFENRIGERLLASAWWDYSPKCLWAFDYTDPAAFCSRFEEAADRGSLEPLTPLRTGSSDVLAALAESHSKTEEPK